FFPIRNLSLGDRVGDFGLWRPRHGMIAPQSPGRINDLLLQFSQSRRWASSTGHSTRLPVHRHAFAKDFLKRPDFPKEQVAGGTPQMAVGVHVIGPYKP